MSGDTDKELAEKITKNLRKKQRAYMRKLKRIVEGKKEIDEFVKNLKETENEKI